MACANPSGWQLFPRRSLTILVFCRPDQVRVNWDYFSRSFFQNRVVALKASGWFLGCGATLSLVICLIGTILAGGGVPFSPGPLGTEHPQNVRLSDFVSHADFESRCELCHAPFQGPDASRCMDCHTDIHNQVAMAQGIHGQMPNPQTCVVCHTDHKGRAASLTRVSLVDVPHNQFGFALVRHQRDYEGAPMTCRSCHTFAVQAGKPESAAVLAACVDCHARRDAKFVADHRAAMGAACLACHDGSGRLQGFDHAAVFALDGKHAQVACAKCHVNNRFRGTPRECVQCHADPAIHRGQFSNACAACHTSTGWRPARLIQHTFPLDHGNKQQTACKVCHPANYGTYTCYNCHEHEQNKTARIHLDANIRDFQNCTQCHRTGKKIE